MAERVHDFVAIGVGPFNLGLAALAAPITELDGIFLDARPAFGWHPGMMLESAHLQVPFLADLVTMADPTSPYSFLNYLKQAGRLYPFYIREDFYPLRAEFDAYCRWVVGSLPAVRFGQSVEDVAYDDAAGTYRVTATSAAGSTVHHARRLVLGTGTTPAVPEHCADLVAEASSDVIHSSGYLASRGALLLRDDVTVVGSGQSAAEVFHDLLSADRTRTLRWITRSPRFFPLEYTKLTLEMTSPEYVDYFHGLPPTERDRLGAEQKNLYKGIDGDLVNAIYDLLYQRSVAGAPDVEILTNTALTAVERSGGGLELSLHHEEQDRRFSLSTGAVVLATGYSYREPAFLRGISDRIARLPDGRYDVDREYGISRQPGEILVQNAELHTHGFAAPDLGMGAYRNSVIIARMLGHEYYPVENRIAFQRFGAPSGARAEARTH
ncbi:SidA/IucD/PvdA family monooxygenase [Arthrobacter bussei]|uniref:L-lysine N6-monooxygenase MbtG n=1 Tax=Arthrobacter bussei TaxID=2594179 RepID=A0A7X1TNE9_9MICC|nr:alcaligin biosynthesis protein [Arthrobacter bussei]